MGLAALVVGAIIVLAVAVSIVYGTLVGLARLGRLLWRLLVVPEGESPAQVESAKAGIYVKVSTGEWTQHPGGLLPGTERDRYLRVPAPLVLVLGFVNPRT